MRRRLEVRVSGSLAVVHGWQAQKTALEAGIKSVFNGVQGGWCFDAKRLPDLIALCEIRGIALALSEDEEPHDVLREFAAKVLDVDQPDIQPDLFGGGGDVR